MRSSLRVLLLFSLALLGSCTNGGEVSDRAPAPSVTGTASAPTGEDEGEALLYVRKGRLLRLDIGTGEVEKLGRLSAGAAIASPDGSSLAYVVDEGASGEEDFLADPKLHLRELGGTDTTIGPGLSPTWHPSGDRLAYLEPGEARVCEGEVCEGSSSVVVADLAEETRRTLLPDGRWGLFGWSGDDLLVAVVDDDSALPMVQAVSEDGKTEPLELVPSELWGASPDGSTLVTVSAGRTLLESRADGSKRPLDLGDGILGEGSWSPSSERLGAVLLRGGDSTLVLADLSGEVTEVEDSNGAAGPVLWSSVGSSFVYVRERGLRLEAVHCASPSACRPLFDWPRGVALLALTPSAP